MIGEALDNLIGMISPTWGMQRMAARATMAQIQSFSGGGTGAYDAGKINRLTKYRLGSQIKENAVPVDQIAHLRWQSWALFRNNPWARKIVRSLQSKIVGRGMKPASQAKNEDGTPHVEFRKRTQELWDRIQNRFDFRGLPGKGGLSFVEIQRLALLSVILSGEVLARPRPLNDIETKKRGSPISLSIQLVDCDRLAIDSQRYDVTEGNAIYRGIEIDQEGRRAAYHLVSYPIGAPSPTYSEVKRVPADQMIHAFVEDDVDQVRGVPWFASALLQMRDTGDYQYNELKASAMAACVTLLVRRPTGATKAFGVNPSSEQESQDEDGNPVSHLQPGMIINTGKDGGLEGFNPSRPGANAEAFIQHMLRGTACAFPGVKSSTLTGDYRGSSFSSERSADNDLWPELEGVQDWFASHFLQPIFEEIVKEAVLAGWYDKIVTPEEFKARRDNFVSAEWQGPIGRSINPKDDATAAALRVKAGISTPQYEAAAMNLDLRDVMQQIKEVYDLAKEFGLPDEVVNNILSVDAQDVIPPEGADDGADGSSTSKGAGNAKQTIAAA